MNELLPTLVDLTLIHAESDGGGIGVLLFIGPAIAFTFYGLMNRYYRNFDKRFKIEESTEVSGALIDSTDLFVKHMKGQNRGSIRNRNDKLPTERVGKL